MSEPAFPETGRERAAIACAACACLLALPIVWTPSGLVDEVLSLSEGLRVMAGQVVYKDFFQFLGPLCSWIPAMVVATVGPSVAALRVLTALVMGLAAWQLHQVARGLGAGPWLAALPGLRSGSAPLPAGWISRWNRSWNNPASPSARPNS